MTAALDAGYVMTEVAEALVDDAWIERKPRWAELRDQSFTLATVWTAPHS
ncbi:hypothetical protein ACFXNW_25305 [Nocardia sp. NPDC059180]